MLLSREDTAAAALRNARPRAELLCGGPPGHDGLRAVDREHLRFEAKLAARSLSAISSVMGVEFNWYLMPRWEIKGKLCGEGTGKAPAEIPTV